MANFRTSYSRTFPELNAPKREIKDHRASGCVRFHISSQQAPRKVPPPPQIFAQVSLRPSRARKKLTALSILGKVAPQPGPDLPTKCCTQVIQPCHSGKLLSPHETVQMASFNFVGTYLVLVSQACFGKQNSRKRFWFAPSPHASSAFRNRLVKRVPRTSRGS